MRPHKNQYYLNIAQQVAQRSTCYRAKFGTIIVRDDVIISTGYVGAPRGTKDCIERKNCLREELSIPSGERYELCRSVHAEQNAIINAARSGSSVFNGDIFLYGEDKNGRSNDAFPCFICKKMIINAGLNRVICSTKNGGYNIFNIKDWIEDWQNRDLLDDKHQYGKDKK